jgi:hypothetical protein
LIKAKNNAKKLTTKNKGSAFAKLKLKKNRLVAMNIFKTIPQVNTRLRVRYLFIKKEGVNKRCKP